MMGRRSAEILDQHVAMAAGDNILSIALQESALGRLEVQTLMFFAYSPDG
jgi:hypothetical protein